MTTAREIVEQCTQRERLVVMLRYDDELTWEEIAAVMDCSLAEVHAMHDAVIERVRPVKIPK